MTYLDCGGLHIINRKELGGVIIASNCSDGIAGTLATPVIFLDGAAGAREFFCGSVVSQFNTQQLEFAIEVGALQPSSLGNPCHIATFLIDELLKISFLKYITRFT